MSQPGPFLPPVQLELAQCEERFRLLVESVSDYAIFMLDPQGRVMSWNAGAQRIKGYTEEEILDKPFSIFYTLEDIAAKHPQQVLRQAMQLGRYEEEGWRVRKDGSRFWAKVTVTPVFEHDGSLRGFAKVTQDLTQQTEALSNEQSFKALVHGVKDYAIFMLDMDGCIVTWNLGAERIKGYRPEEIIGKHISVFYTPEDIAQDHAAKELEIAAREGRFEEEGWRVRKDGTRFWANVVITLLTQNGKPAGFAKVTRDMTQRRAMEEQLRELNGQLESFAYSVAHDLRAPLRAIASTSRMLLEDAADALEDEQKDLLSRQNSNALKLTGIVDDLLRMARISSAEVQLSEVDVSEIAEEIARQLAEEHPSPCKFDIQKGVLLNADSTLMHVVLQNLLENAVKFSPNGGTISFGCDEATFTCFVKDEGVGFDMAYAEKVFLPFERLVRDEEFSGSGIGLANVKLAIARHGGKIWVESEIGKGTTFYFSLMS